MSGTSPPLAATIRSATRNDVPAILALIRELAEYEKLSHACVVTEESLRQHLFGPQGGAETLVAELPEAAAPCVVGYAVFFTTFSTFTGRPGLFLEDIYVQPAYRRRGLGRRLLQAVAALAVERHCGRLEWSVLDWNTPSIEFYQSLGATPLKEWTMFRLSGDALDRLGR